MSISLIFTLLISIMLAGCALTPAPQSEKLKKVKHTISEKEKIMSVPFIKQKAAYCGPASIAMVLNYYGESVSQEELSKKSFIANANGTFQEDMLSTIRRRGYLPVIIKNISGIISEHKENRPVIVFTNLGFDWLPLWHYSVVIGHDIDKNVFYLHSGEKQKQKQEIDKFERNWSRANYWGVSILKPGEISMSADLIDHVRSAASLEEIGLIEKAKISYEAIIKKWPKNHIAYIGLGNIAFKKGHIKKAYTYFKQAHKINPKDAISKNNMLQLEELIEKIN